MAKPISLNEIRRRSARFAAEWRHEPGEEKQQGQSFVRDLLAVYGITKTKAALYEKRARRSSTGRRGYIDALVPGLCVIEMKSRDDDLETAEKQALDYLGNLTDAEMPRWVITCDFSSFRVLDLEADNGRDTDEFNLEDLPNQSVMLAFLAGYQQREFGSREQETASIKAAQLMGDLYDALDDTGFGDHEVSMLLVRILFCMYADDAGVWGERDLFYEFIETRTNEDGSDLGGQLSILFQTLNQKEDERPKNLDELIARFPYVNGDLFADAGRIPSFDVVMRRELLQACAFNWSTISPAIFGSLFQAVKEKQARRELGEHYTTETNILKTINPLFMDELRDRFAANAHTVGELKRLRRDLGDMRVLDPACGCGNFLLVAYRELRALDLAILQRLQELGDTTQIPALFFTKANLPVVLNNFVGIEVEEWPARIAGTALHLVDHQADQAMELALGKAPESLPLGKMNIIHVDNALRINWDSVLTPSKDVRVIGNPPFVGHKNKTTEQTLDLQHVWGTQYTGDLDYVTGWYKKAADYFAVVPGGRFAFVSTNSIAQGQSVQPLFTPLLDAGWRIRFAHRTFAWSSEAPGAAAVHCVIVGFDKEEKTRATLYTYDSIKGNPAATPVQHINPYLTDAPDVLVTKRRTPLSPELAPSDFGSMPNDGGHLLVGATDYEGDMADPVAKSYLRPFVQARELIHGLPRWCLWLVDLDPAQLAESPNLKARVAAVQKFRKDSRRETTRALAATPHLFGEIRQPTSRYLAIPRHVGESRQYFPVARFDPDVICGDANFTTPDPDGFAFAIISSSMFLAWQRAAGGMIKSDLRFSSTIVWNTFPLPPVNPAQRAKIIEAGHDVLTARATHPERSLADHYNPLAMDPVLLKAHRALDRLVDKTFTRKTLNTLRDRQRTLFSVYADYTK